MKLIAKKYFLLQRYGLLNFSKRARSQNSGLLEFQKKLLWSNVIWDQVFKNGPSKVCLSRTYHFKFCKGCLPQTVISIKLQSNIIKIALRHGCSPVNLLYIFRTHFPKNTSEGLLQSIWCSFFPGKHLLKPTFLLWKHFNFAL